MIFLSQMMFESIVHERFYWNDRYSFNALTLTLRLVRSHSISVPSRFLTYLQVATVWLQSHAAAAHVFVPVECDGGGGRVAVVVKYVDFRKYIYTLGVLCEYWIGIFINKLSDDSEFVWACVCCNINSWPHEDKTTHIHRPQIFSLCSKCERGDGPVSQYALW